MTVIWLIIGIAKKMDYDEEVGWIIGFMFAMVIDCILASIGYFIYLNFIK